MSLRGTRERLNRGRLCTSISSETVEGMARKARRALQLGSDIVEFRIDHLRKPNAKQIAHGLSPSISSDRCVLTVRSKDEGGGFLGDEEERAGLLGDLCEMIEPAFVDLEFGTANKLGWLLHRVRRSAGEVILSWHDFQGTPEAGVLTKRLRQMKRSREIVKIVTFANSNEDNLRILSLYGDPGREKLIAFCMGEKGRFSRVLSLYAGSPIVYASMPGESVAPGQLSIGEVKELIGILG